MKSTTDARVSPLAIYVNSIVISKIQLNVLVQLTFLAQYNKVSIFSMKDYNFSFVSKSSQSQTLNHNHKLECGSHIQSTNK